MSDKTSQMNPLCTKRRSLSLSWDADSSIHPASKSFRLILREKNPATGRRDYQPLSSPSTSPDASHSPFDSTFYSTIRLSPLIPLLNHPLIHLKLILDAPSIHLHGLSSRPSLVPRTRPYLAPSSPLSSDHFLGLSSQFNLGQSSAHPQPILSHTRQAILPPPTNATLFPLFLAPL